MQSRNVLSWAIHGIAVLVVATPEILMGAPRDDAAGTDVVGPRAGAARTEVVGAHSKPVWHWRSGPFCGVNATYAFLRLLDVDVSYDDLSNRIPVTAAGSNLEDMKRCVLDFGVAATVVQSTPSDLLDIPKPFIALFERDEREGYEPSARGHYVVVLDANKHSVRYIDGATARIEGRSAEKFVRDWSGFLLVSSAKQPDTFLFAALAILVLGVVLFRGEVARTVAKALSFRTRLRSPEGCRP